MCWLLVNQGMQMVNMHPKQRVHYISSASVVGHLWFEVIFYLNSPIDGRLLVEKLHDFCLHLAVLSWHLDFTVEVCFFNCQVIKLIKLT